MEIKEPTKGMEIVKVLDNTVLSILGNEQMQGFERAFRMAEAIGELKKILTPEVMKPIMNLQGNRLGFKTDKDVVQGGGKGPGYPMEIVRDCLIEAVLFGVQPTGNQFNIIGGNFYATKEGCGYLLSKIPGLDYTIVAQLPRIKEESAAVVMEIEWIIGGRTNKKLLDIPIRVNKFMGTDAVLGKATRKARKWLYDKITGNELPEGDIQDVDAQVVGSKINETVSLEDLTLLFDNKKPFLTAEDVANAERIIGNKEEASYTKLYKHLQTK
jgi:hypothetical protein